MKKILTFLFLILIFSFVFAQEIQFGNIDSSPVTDGPYISRQNENVSVDYVLNGKAVNKTFPIQELEDHNLIIPDLNFNQKIKFDHPIPNDSFRNVDEFLVVSDIHGQFQQFEKILKNNAVIDEESNWIWQDGHLIVLGDIFDRGPQVTESLWLIYKLENQAKSVGGKVHILLGNHELMIFQNDLRYVHEKYSLESKQIDQTYTELFSVNTVLGNWLRSKPVIVKIDDYLFCHAGISPILAENFTDYQTINDIVYNKLQLSDFQEETESETLIFHSNGPFWYRGYFQSSKRYEKITQLKLDEILTKFNSEKIIIGHTTQDSILTFWNGKVIAVDSGIKYGDQGEGLLYQNGSFHRVFSKGKKKILDFQH